MPFSPKFFDLVRVTSTSTGTGPMSLGGAVPGYVAFNAALVTGDQFYYCVQGIDKPSEREVGRGTLLSGGRLGREAISGTLTNFSSGTKTVALVAAAEWFDKLEQGGGGGGSGGETICATRTALASAAQSKPALLTDGSGPGLFLFVSADLSAMVSADPRQGVIVAPAADPTGASGAWVRQFDGPMNVRWFGAVGDDTGSGTPSDDGPAFAAAIALAMKATQPGTGVLPDHAAAISSVVRVPNGNFYLGTTTLDITNAITIEGENVANGGTTLHTSHLRWAAGTTGIRVQNSGTSGATGDTGAATRGCSIIRNLALKGAFSNYTSTPEGEYHGVMLRGAAMLENLYITHFQGDGVHTNTNVSGTTTKGNANTFKINNCTVQWSRNGIFIDGPDGNAGIVMGCDTAFNRAWGIFDSSFLGNCIVGCHADSNGFAYNGNPSAVVSFNGNRYAVKLGSTGASTTAPTGAASDNAQWLYLGVGGPLSFVPAWTSGIAVREGGAFGSDNSNAQTTWLGCYSESAQGPSQLAYSNVTIGHHFAGHHGGAYVRGGSGDKTRVSNLYAEGAASFTDNLTASGNLIGGGGTHQLRNDGASSNELWLVSPTGATYDSLWFKFGSAYHAGLVSQQGTAFHIRGYPETRFHAGSDASPVQVATIDSGGINLQPGKVVKVGGTQVVGARGAAVADAVAAVAAPTQAEFNALVAVVNMLLGRLRAATGHGLIA